MVCDDSGFGDGFGDGLVMASALVLGNIVNSLGCIAARSEK